MKKHLWWEIGAMVILIILAIIVARHKKPEPITPPANFPNIVVPSVTPGPSDAEIECALHGGCK